MLIYRNTIDLCIMLLYSVNVLCSFFSLCVCRHAFLTVLYILITFSANKSFTFYFPIWIVLISFFSVSFFFVCFISSFSLFFLYFWTDMLVQSSTEDVRSDSLAFFCYLKPLSFSSLRILIVGFFFLDASYLGVSILFLDCWNFFHKQILDFPICFYISSAIAMWFSLLLICSV